MNRTSNRIDSGEMFEQDPYPGKPKLLFVGVSNSTHTRSWIDLLAGAEFNIRLFSSNEGVPPEDWEIATYVTSPSPVEEAGKYRQNLHPTLSKVQEYNEALRDYSEKLQQYKRRKPSFYLLAAAQRGLRLYARLFGLPELDYNYPAFSRRSIKDYQLGKKPHPKNLPLPPIPFQAKAESPQAWLAQVIRDWKPDIIHALGCFDLQGGEFLFETLKRFDVDYRGKIVLQLRGGSDLALRKYNPEALQQIADIFRRCDQIITDNRFNIEYIQELGFADKVASIAPVPGTGGVDTSVEVDDITWPSKKERLILYPKAYESTWSKALPVLEAITLAWDEIKPCRIFMTASTPETETWFRSLPAEIQENCTLVERVPHTEIIDLMKKARVLLAPSLVDGIPNSLYEAMAYGTFPIVSPLETIQTLVKNNVNVLFARNLYPQEISRTLARAMSDDKLVDNAAKNNLRLVKEIASRRAIARRAAEYYSSLAGSGSNGDCPLVTVITPTYNRADYLPETIRSVLSQNYPNVEYIVLDDGSKDNTREIMEKYRERVIFESHANMGETRTVNKGFEMANGDIIGVVNSDDPLLPDAIRSVVEFMQAHPQIGVVYPDWDYVDTDGKKFSHIQTFDYSYINMLRWHHCIPGPGTFFRREVVEKLNGRDPQFCYVGDFDFWLRAGLITEFARLPKTLATFRIHPNSASTSQMNERMAQEHIALINKIYSLPNLKRDTKRYKREAYSSAYYIAGCVCQSCDTKVRRGYFAQAIRYAPLKYLGEYRKNRLIEVIIPVSFPWMLRIYPTLKNHLYLLWKNLEAKIKSAMREGKGNSANG